MALKGCGESHVTRCARLPPISTPVRLQDMRRLHKSRARCDLGKTRNSSRTFDPDPGYSFTHVEMRPKIPGWKLTRQRASFSISYGPSTLSGDLGFRAA